MVLICLILQMFSFSVLLVMFASTAATATKNIKSPNFILVLTDDLDLTLGGAQASTLAKTRNLIASKGITFTNWFAQTPVCCPSRAELMTGRMLHNIKKTRLNASGCMAVSVSEDLNIPFYESYYFAQYFAKLNYTVGVFGKHLNTHNPKSCPPGVDRWLVNGGGEYLNPEFYWASGGTNSTNVQFNNCTSNPCYSTSVIGNASIDWIRDHVASEKRQKPFFAYVSVKAPHIQDELPPDFPKAIPAPWYQNTTIPEEKAPRIPNYNLSCPNHHWLVRNQPPLTTLQGNEVDKLYQSRLKSLLSVDDLVEEMIQTLDDLEILDNTYVIFTSDNGFRLGQFRIPESKLHPYENDIRLPMMIRGPRLPQGLDVPVLGSHVDLMPTLLGLAANSLDDSVIPSSMDGANLAKDFLFYEGNGGMSKSIRRPTKLGIKSKGLSLPTSSLLIEYLSLGNVVRYEHMIDTYNHTFLALRVLDFADPLISNLKYIEFFDARVDWDFKGNAIEYELFDLDEDPFETHNIINEVPSSYRQSMHDKMMRLLHCKGQVCREESKIGLNRSTRSKMPLEVPAVD